MLWGVAQRGVCGVDVQRARLVWASIMCALVVLPSLHASRSSAVALLRVPLKARVATARDAHWK